MAGCQPENKERFISLCRKINRPGIDKLMEWIELNSDFYTAPASTRFHGSYVGGLLEHSLNVYDELVRIINAYPEIKVDEESIIIASLFHDLCKANMYVSEKRNRKNERGQWESYDSYTVKEKFCFGGHGSKSMFLLMHFIDLHPEEAIAINGHMGSWDGNKDVSAAYEHCPFAWAVHVADEAATFIKESDGN